MRHRTAPPLESDRSPGDFDAGSGGGPAIEAARRDYDLDVAIEATRRNVVTRDVALNHLVGREFTVGEVRLRGVRLCEPCEHMEKLSGVAGIRKAMLHRGGLRADIVRGGTISVGDTVEA